MKLKYISLGGACRPAAQIKKNCSESLAFPFDWTITSFNSLQNIFIDNFDVSKVLSNESIDITKSGGIRCSISGIYFHHGLNSYDCSRWLCTPLSKFTHTMPAEFYKSKELQDIKERFLYTYKRLMELNNDSNIIVFIRWLGFGRNGDKNQTKLPHAGIPEGCSNEENFFKLIEILKNKYPKLDFRLYHIFSSYTENPGENRIIDSFNFEGLGGIYLLNEKIPEKFSGDDESWKQFFKCVQNNLI